MYVAIVTFILLMPATSLCVSRKELTEMSISEYLHHVNYPAIHSFKEEEGDMILCMRFEDQISVRSSSAKITLQNAWESARKLSYNYYNQPNGSEQMCPVGTIFKVETRREEIQRASSIQAYHTNISQFHNEKLPGSRGDIHEYATEAYYPGPYGGVSAYFNVWTPEVLTAQPSALASFSLAQLWVMYLDTKGAIQETLEAGWQVYPIRHKGGVEPYFFLFSTNDGYKSGCYNLDCPGFVSTTNDAFIGKPIKGSALGYDSQVEVKIEIKKEEIEDVGMVYWVAVENEALGFWVAETSSQLAKRGANNVSVGGEVAWGNAAHTQLPKIQMGSGEWPMEGYGKAAYIRNIKLYDYASVSRIQPLPVRDCTASQPLCYAIERPPSAASNPGFKEHFFFGGPGAKGNNLMDCKVQ